GEGGRGQHARELIGAGAKLGERVLAHSPRVVLVHERHARTIGGMAIAHVDGNVVVSRHGPAEARVNVRVGLAVRQERVRHGPVAYHSSTRARAGGAPAPRRPAARTAAFDARLGRRGPRPATACSAHCRVTTVISSGACRLAASVSAPSPRSSSSVSTWRGPT